LTVLRFCYFKPSKKTARALKADPTKTNSLISHPAREVSATIIVAESAVTLKGFIANTGLSDLARKMLLRLVLAYIIHRGRMSCSAAAGCIAADSIRRGELTYFITRPRWQPHDFNNPLMKLSLARKSKRGKFLFLIDAALVSQAGKKTKTFTARAVVDAIRQRDVDIKKESRLQEGL